MRLPPPVLARCKGCGSKNALYAKFVLVLSHVFRYRLQLFKVVYIIYR